MLEDLKDIFGVKIEEGDIVTFPTRAGSYLGMNIAKVVSVETVQDERYSWARRESEPYMRHEVTVQSLTTKYDPKTRTFTNVWGRKAKPSTHRLVKVQHSIAEVEAMSDIDVS